MNKLFISMFAILASLSVVNAQSKSKAGSEALKLNLEWGDDFENATEKERKPYLDTLNAALSIVQALPPAEDNLFNWTGNRAVLTNKTFTIYYTNSDDKYVKKLLTDTGATTTKFTDAATFMLGSKDEKISIFSCVFADKIFWDQNKIERTDSVTRLTVALAHEIYGNVQMYLKYNPAKKLPSRKQAEINAFTAGIDFINRAQVSLKNGTLSKLPNKEKLIKDFNNALKIEKASLEYWKKVPDNIK